jgi:hypothetical protein
MRLTSFKYAVNCAQWIVNEHNEMSQLINHPLNTILNIINHDFYVFKYTRYLL